MKNNLKLILLLMLTGLTGCVKNYDLEPVKSDLTGVWSSADQSITWVIENTHGEGYNAKFTDIKKDKQRWLKVEMPTIHETYKVAELTNHDMVLVDSKQIPTTFNKIK